MLTYSYLLHIQISVWHSMIRMLAYADVCLPAAHPDANVCWRMLTHAYLLHIQIGVWHSMMRMMWMHPQMHPLRMNYNHPHSALILQQRVGFSKYFCASNKRASVSSAGVLVQKDLLYRYKSTCVTGTNVPDSSAERRRLPAFRAAAS
jgi:hypothetical protein